MRKKIASFLAFSMLCTALIGCQASTTGNTSGVEGNLTNTQETTFGITPLEERTTLRVGFFSGSAHGMPFYIADKMGFFDELNIDVEYESFIAGPPMMEASASWDVCDVGGPGVLNGMKNYDIRMIGLCDNEPNNAIFVRADSEIAKDPTNPEVWKGKKVILNAGTMLQYLCASYLSSIGASIDDVEIISMDVTSGLTAFKAGEGDAVCAWNAVAYAADDAGFVRVTDMGTLGLDNIVGMCATNDALENKKELVEKAWLVYYMTWDWCNRSDENMQKAVTLFVESCEDEGVVADESICRRTLEAFRCPTPAIAYSVMTTQVSDSASGKNVSEASKLLFATLDFFIEVGSYTKEDREAIMEKGLVDPVIAEGNVEILRSLQYID